MTAKEFDENYKIEEMTFPSLGTVSYRIRKKATKIVIDWRNFKILKKVVWKEADPISGDDFKCLYGYGWHDNATIFTIKSHAIVSLASLKTILLSDDVTLKII